MAESSYHYGDSPPELRSYLEGVDFPASKEELVRHVTDKGAPDDIIEYMQHLPDQEYTGLIDVVPELFEAEY